MTVRSFTLSRFMDAIMGLASTNHQHKQRGSVLPLHRQSVESRLTAAFVRLPRHLPKDPDKYLFRNRRRSSNALACPARKAVAAARATMIAAIETGDNAIIERTAEEVALYGEEIVAAMLTEYHARANGESSLPAVSVDAHRTLLEAAHAIALSMGDRCASSFEFAIQRVTATIDPLKHYRTIARLQLTAHSRNVRAVR